MSADHDFAWLRCACDFCVGQGDESSAAWNRSYYVPDPPKIPGTPGGTVSTPTRPPTPTSTPPSSPTPPTTAPPVEEPGWAGPRFYTLLRGDDWNDPQVGVPAVVPYTFATRAMSYYADGDSIVLPGFASTSGQPLTEVQRANIRQALDAWSRVSGLTFVEVSDIEQWNFHGIRFLMESVDVHDLLASTRPSGDPYGFNVIFNRTFYGGSGLEPGTGGYWTALHEIGHAIGLKHPFEGGTTLKASENNNANTIMSYTDKGNLFGLGPFDVAAVQHLYGGPEAKAWAPVQWHQGPGGSLLITGNHQDNYILGSVAPDVAYAGAGNDHITLDAGNDYVVPGAGNDAVFGRDGVDILYTGKFRSQAVVTISYVEEGEEVSGTILMPNDELDTFYGVETLDFINGSIATDPRGDGAKLFRLYDAAFNRRPDPMGFAHWMDALRDGTVYLRDIATEFTTSREFTAKYGRMDNVELAVSLYLNVLDRLPGPKEYGDVLYWADVMRIAGRGHALLDFSETKEHFDKTKEDFANGKFYYNQDSVDVLRAYLTVLDRRPEADGLVSWTNAREAGVSQADLVAQMASSQEFQTRFGGLSNRDYVQELYEVALDRPGDAAGVAFWTNVLDGGMASRAGVALGFSNSAEMTALVTYHVHTSALDL